MDRPETYGHKVSLFIPVLWRQLKLSIVCLVDRQTDRRTEPIALPRSAHAQPRGKYVVNHVNNVPEILHGISSQYNLPFTSCIIISDYNTGHTYIATCTYG